MADGVSVDNGTLTDFTVATDDAGAAGHVQLFKLAHSADGSTTLVTADSSGLKVQASATLPVSDSTAQGKLDTIITLLGTSVATQVWKSGNYTTTQTGTAIWTPASGKKIAITSLSIGSYGTTAARLILWFGASGDTTYSAGTDQPVFIGSFAPSATGYPGALPPLASPILCANADYLLRITTDAALSVDIVAFGYEF